MDEAKRAVTIKVRVGVFVGDAAVGGPASVADGDMGIWQRGLGDRDLADVLVDQHLIAGWDGYSP